MCGGKSVIDAEGLAIAPGFIDTHGHSEFTVIADPGQEGKLFQGITTEINGNCGLSAAPLYGDYLSHRMEDLREYDIPYRWNSLNEFFEILEEIKPALNFATLVGHGNIRGSVMGFRSGKPSEKELKEMKRLLEEALLEGAIGLSSGLIYPPGIYSDTDELIELTEYGIRISKPYRPFIYASHMRSESDNLIEALEEVIEIAKRSGSPVHISHLKTAGRNNWNKIDRVLEIIHRAKDHGLTVSADRYPYTASSTDLDSVLPAWVFEGGKEEELKRLRTKSKELKKYLSTISPDEIVISSVENPENKWMEGKSLKEISINVKKEIPEVIIDILIEENLRVGAIFHSMSEDNLQRFLKEPYMTVGTDSSSRSFGGPTRKGKPHPRGFGSMPRFIGLYCRQIGLFSLEQAIMKITSLPAKIFGIKDRGIIKTGAFADLVIFDPEKIIDRADFNNPFLKPEGIHYVFINGLPAIWKGEPTLIRNGRVLRSGG
ncbi:MAG: D-aminoacylase [Thermodesulfovibrionales bacterium]|nr:D-aminoacylase [Thermodesulfovibrionales bacterium]